MMDYEDYELYYDDGYGLGELPVEYQADFVDSYTIRNLWHDCLTPTLQDGFSAVIPMLLCCFLQRFTSSLRFLPSSIIHVTSGSLGMYCLYTLFGMDFLYILLFAVVGLFSMLCWHMVRGTQRGILCATTCFLFLILCELFFVEQVVWHKIRGSQMVLAMKLISLSFDIDHGEYSMPPLDQCFGYLFSVGTVAFGPWISFSTYQSSSENCKKNNSWILKVAKTALLSFFFLTISTCWCSWFLQYTSWKWVAVYRDALSFRSSHYFVCYISEALSLASGISQNTETWEVPVARPQYIEVPRSLVEVVIHWNIPIHYWLKKYVFKTAKPLGKFLAILLTYASSSLLHGLNFQLAAVLLSLGFYTYVEHVLRAKLATIFNACILARSCKENCNHRHKNTHLLTLVCNVGFWMLAVFHLAYLGVMFDSSTSSEEEGYNMQHTLGKWSELDFASHWVACSTYILYFSIKFFQPTSIPKKVK